MNNKDITFIQDQIGYEFKNKVLLQQAFVRRSYSQENGGQNNEVLEFIGDKALDFSVVRLLSRRYGHITNGASIDVPKSAVTFNQHFAPMQQRNYTEDSLPNEFICSYDEGILSNLKAKLVNKKTLADRIDNLGLAEYLIMGKGNIEENVSQKSSVKEDLFESILGAVTLDCNWDMQEILDTVEIMLVPEQYLADDEEKNYVELIQEWALWKNHAVPLYHFEKASYQSTWYLPFKGISQRFPPSAFREMEEVQFYCLLNLKQNPTSDSGLPIFRGFGRSKAEARMAVCKVAYEHLKQNKLLFSIRDEIDNPNKGDAISQLETLARRGYFPIPVYDFKLEHDNNGNPIWECTCRIDTKKLHFRSKSSSKKDAKKSAAFQMLTYVLEKTEKE